MTLAIFFISWHDTLDKKRADPVAFLFPKLFHIHQRKENIVEKDSKEIRFGFLDIAADHTQCLGHDAEVHMRSLFDDIGGNYPEDRAALPEEDEPIEFLVPADSNSHSDPVAHAIAAEEGHWPDGTPFEGYSCDTKPNDDIPGLIRQLKPRPSPVYQNTASGSSAGSAPRIRTGRGNYSSGKKGRHRDALLTKA